MNDYKSAFNAAAADLSAIIALLGFTKHPGVDPVLRAITDLILEKAENQVLREERDAANKRADTLEHRMMGMMTRHFAEAWRNRDTQKALDGYLSAGIAQLEQERDAALDKISKLESRWPHGESPEERFEHYISNTIDRAPEPLRRLGNWLSHVLDEDQWTTAERMLTGACVAAEERAAEQTQHSAPDVCDGKEQDAFEEWARKEGLDTSCHPMHWLFLDAKTNSARQGWKAALRYVRAHIAAPSQAQHSVPEGWMLVPVEPLLNMMSDKDHDTRITAERQLLAVIAAAPALGE
ncbi:TPA: hypothetical protein ACKP5U_003288 [Pseudomonas aeruginosa]|uniref:hypothetical protein n=1 Tax=Pseudomonas aeruginosa TaxID=287 RepID=UPI00155AA4C9|nr:hypothetical protein [Pseudomonas aeruginosa]HEJ2170550.1 hypothetical protein [Pseudomonas aeruginosa]HEK1445037.1 hypothetical protein [Pseudomonas aeruginosa]